MKKLIFLLLSLTFLLAACGSEEPVSDSSDEIHPHTFSEPGANLTHHYMVCECGEKENLVEHDLNEDHFCGTCGFYIYGIGDGEYSFYIPDEQGNIVIQQDFDAYEKLIYDWRAEYEYYEDGNPKLMKEYLDGVLLSEQVYLRCEDPKNGEVYISETVYFHEDGGREILVYDERFYLLSYTLEDSLGEIVTQDIYTYQFTQDGNISYESCHTDGIISMEIFYEPDSDGYYYPACTIHYDANGQIESEFRFDEFGNEIS